MILALSTAAAPRATLNELVEGCARRGLHGLHLVEGHGHGISLESSESHLLQALTLCEEHGIVVSSLEASSRRAVTPDRAAAITRILRAPLVIGWHEPVNDWTNAFERAGGLHTGGITLDAAKENVLDSSRTWPDDKLPRHITLLGAGPESARYEGRGIGSLMMKLSLSAYQGVLVLAPTSRAVLPVWNAWLGHGRSWGCGSHKSDPSQVTIG